jgi:hypothetical protein
MMKSKRTSLEVCICTRVSFELFRLCQIRLDNIGQNIDLATVSHRVKSCQEQIKYPWSIVVKVERKERLWLSSIVTKLFDHAWDAILVEKQD